MIYTATSSRPIGVDRESGVIRGIVMAQTGPFKTRRGQFDLEGLKKVQQLAAAEPKGLRSFFRHPTEAEPDPLARFLGRVTDPYLSKVNVKRNGQQTQLDAVRGDLHLAGVALKPPPGGGTPYGEYVLDMAESDSDALAASLQLKVDKQRPTDGRGRAVTGVPPLWVPLSLAGVDIVGTGDATDGLLQAEDFDDDFLDDALAADCLLGLLEGDDLELLRSRWRNRLRHAGLLDRSLDDELLRAKWRQKKRKAGVA